MNFISSARNPDFSEGAPVASLCPEINNISLQSGPTPMANDSFHNNGTYNSNVKLLLWILPFFLNFVFGIIIWDG